MLGLMENQLKYENIPNGYELCFNNNCQQRESCLHYQAEHEWIMGTGRCTHKVEGNGECV